MSRLAMVALVLSIGCSKTEPTPAPTAPPVAPVAPAASTKDPVAAKRMIAAGATVIDVRTTEEYGTGHLDTSTNIPLQSFAERIPEIDTLVGGDKTKPIVLHCAGGGRANKAKAQLEAAGYTQVVNGGGLDDLR